MTMMPDSRLVLPTRGATLRRLGRALVDASEDGANAVATCAELLHALGADADRNRDVEVRHTTVLPDSGEQNIQRALGERELHLRARGHALTRRERHCDLDSSRAVAAYAARDAKAKVLVLCG